MSSDKRRRSWDGRRIRALRSHLGLTQTEMAARLGTRQQTISEWEKGMYQPRGASATLLSIVAEGSAFKYDAGYAQAEGKGDTGKTEDRNPAGRISSQQG